MQVEATRPSIQELALEGELDIFQAAFVEEQIRRRTSLPGDLLILSFEDVRYVSSAIVNVLVSYRSRLGERLLIVVPAGGTVRRVLRVLRLEERLDVHATLEGARARARRVLERV
jgi:anti-anti-sigma factor